MSTTKLCGIFFFFIATEVTSQRLIMGANAENAAKHSCIKIFQYAALINLYVHMLRTIEGEHYSNFLYMLTHCC